MGPTSAGKTTIGGLLVETLRSANYPAIQYDGDEIRSFFNDTLGFKPEDRLRAVATCAHLASKSSIAGLNTVVSALTANDDARAFIRKNIPNLFLVYLKCPITICIERDSKGLYDQAKRGVIDASTLIGLNTPYREPEDPDIVIDTLELSPSQSVDAIVGQLVNCGWLFEG